MFINFLEEFFKVRERIQSLLYLDHFEEATEEETRFERWGFAAMKGVTQSLPPDEVQIEAVRDAYWDALWEIRELMPRSNK